MSLMLCLESIYSGVSGSSGGLRWRCHFSGHLGSEGREERKDSMIRASCSPNKVDTGASACSEMLQSGAQVQSQEH